MKHTCLSLDFFFKPDDFILLALAIKCELLGHVRRRKPSQFGHLCWDHGYQLYWKGTSKEGEDAEGQGNITWTTSNIGLIWQQHRDAAGYRRPPSLEGNNNINNNTNNNNNNKQINLQPHRVGFTYRVIQVMVVNNHTWSVEKMKTLSNWFSRSTVLLTYLHWLLVSRYCDVISSFVTSNPTFETCLSSMAPKHIHPPVTA